MNVNLTKEEAEKNFVDLTKKAENKVALAGLNGQKSQVVLVMDISASMTKLFKKGIVQQITERSLALGIQFDDDGSIPVYLFGENSHEAITLTQPDFYGFVDREITQKYKLEYNTLYAKPIEKIINDLFPGSIQMVQPEKNKGLFKRLMGSDSTPTMTINGLGQPVNEPVFVIFITDGNNGDKAKAEELISKAAILPMFIQFVGIGNESFSFLKKLDDLEGRIIDNAGFCHIQGIETISDDDFLGEMLNEFPEYLREAHSRGLIA